MTTKPDFERSVAAWLDAEAGGGMPDYLDEIEARVARAGQRPWWSSLERWLPVDISAPRTVLPSRFPMRSVALLAILGLLLAAVLAFALGAGQRRLPPPFGPARNGALVFEKDGDIYRLDPTTGAATVSVGGPEADQAPLFSRDGTQFAFLRGSSVISRQIGIATADGAAVRVLPDRLRDVKALDWSPDGTRIAVVAAAEHGGWTAWMVDPSGQRPPEALDLGPLNLTGWLAWGPDAGGILYFGAKSSLNADDMALYSAGADGAGLRALTPVLGADHFWDPSLSPDGTQIAYSTWENNVRDGRLDGWSHILNLADGRDRQVRFGQQDAEIKGKFSPDGTQIVFEQQRNLPNGDWDRQVAISSASGEDQATIPIGPAFGHDLTFAYGFSPDGAQVFVQVGPTTRIYRASDGTALGSELDMSFPPSWQRLGT